MSKKTSKFVKVAELRKTIDEKLITCKDLVVYHQPESPEYVNIRCLKDSKTIEIWDCISCKKLTLSDKFSDNQLYKSLTVPVIVSEELTDRGVKVTHMNLMTEICPIGYVCEDCDYAGPDLYYYRYCKIHGCWTAQ